MKNILCVLIALLLFGQMPTIAFADGDLTYEEGAQPYVETAKDLEVKEEKDRAIAKWILLGDPNNVYYTLSVPVYEQINSYYCGPATVKQVVQYLKSSSKTQQQYAQALGTTTSGTDMTRIPSVLNSEIGSRWYYIYSSIGSYGNWTDKIIYCASNGIPVVLDINTTSVPAFPYNSSGHFVNTSGVDFRILSSGTRSKVRITDPWGPGLGNRWYNASDLYAANNNRWRKAFIW